MEENFRDFWGKNLQKVNMPEIEKLGLETETINFLTNTGLPLNCNTFLKSEYYDYFSFNKLNNIKNVCEKNIDTSGLSPSYLERVYVVGEILPIQGASPNQLICLDLNFKESLTIVPGKFYDRYCLIASSPLKFALILEQYRLFYESLLMAYDYVGWGGLEKSDWLPDGRHILDVEKEMFSIHLKEMIRIDSEAFSLKDFSKLWPKSYSYYLELAKRINYDDDEEYISI